MSSDSDFGGIIRAEVQAPDEAIRDLDKFERIPFSPAILDPVWSSLTRIAALVSDGETISVRLKRFLDARKEILPFSKRLQDAPMLQVLAQFDKFYKYLTAYAGLLTAINDEFPKSGQSRRPTPRKSLIQLCPWIMFLSLGRRRPTQSLRLCIPCIFGSM